MGFLPTYPERKLFISWVKHTSRSESLAQTMDAECYFVDAWAGLGPLKYIARIFLSFWILIRRRPAIVFTMNPPYFLPLCGWIYCLFFQACFLVDSHSAAFDSKKWTWMRPLHSFLVRRAKTSIVTNNVLRKKVEDMGGRCVVITDLQYRYPEGTYEVRPDLFNIVFICTYAVDEPILEVFAAVRGMDNVHVYVTGNSHKASSTIIKSKPANVTMTGYLGNTDYWGLLRASSALMSLTTRDHTMQRGGSEAVSARKPLITSNWPILRETFHKGAIHVDNSAADIRRAIVTLQQDYPRLVIEIGEIAEERIARCQAAKMELESIIAP